MGDTLKRRLLRWWINLRRRSLMPLIISLVIAVGIGGVLSNANQDNSLLVCMLLALLISLVAWSWGWRGGVLMGIVAAAVAAPYPNMNSLVTPPLEMPIWLGLSFCYLLVGLLVGLRGSMYDRLLQTNEELALLSTITTSLNRTLDVSQVQVTALAQIGDLLHPDLIQLYQKEENGENFVLQSARPPLPELSGRVPVVVPATNVLFARVLQSQHAQVISESSGDLKHRPDAIPPDIKCLMAVPLPSRTGIIAVLLIGRKRDMMFSQKDAQFMGTIGHALAISLENARLFQEVRDLSYSDELTGLGNRRMFNLRMRVEIDRVLLSGSPLCLASFDLDYFKRVNDEHGHPAGDEVLREFARRVRQQIRPTDLFCRIGGEEFALVAPETTLATTTAIAERICASIAQTPFELSNDITLPITVSVGVAVFQAPDGTVEDLLTAADTALYAAKANGRNRVEIYEGEPLTAESLASAAG